MDDRIPHILFKELHAITQKRFTYLKKMHHFGKQAEIHKKQAEALAELGNSLEIFLGDLEWDKKEAYFSDYNDLLNASQRSIIKDK